MSLARPYDTIINEAVETLRSETGLTNISPGSISRTLVELPTRILVDLWTDEAAAEDQRNLTSATGAGLDALGDLLGVPRKNIWIGGTSSAGMRFYLATPAVVERTVPAGTLVWPVKDAQRYFMTRTAVVIPKGATEGLTGIRAPYAGAYYTATVGELSVNNAPQDIFCTNLEAVSGSDLEDDESYRYRLSLARMATGGTSSEALRAKLLAFPGVIDVTLFPFRRGAGTLDLIVYTEAVTPSVSTLKAIEDYVSTIVAFGITVKAYGPTTKTVDLTFRTAFQPSTPTADRSTYRQLAASQVQVYIDSLSVGDTFYLDRAEYEVLNVSQNIIDVSTSSMSLNGKSTTPDMITTTTYERVIAGRIEVL